MIVIVVIVVIFIILLGLISMFNPQNQQQQQERLDNKNEIDFSKYTTKNYIMTQTELVFYRELKKITDELDISIFPQVDLERIIQVKDNEHTYRNRIKSRSIDYTLVSNKNCKIICCVELDDYTHNSEKAKKNDEFKNNLFNAVNIPLYRVKVNSNYNLQELKAQISQCVSIKE